MAVDFSIPDSGWRGDLYYWLASLNNLAYHRLDSQLEALLNVPGPCSWEFFAVAAAYGVDVIYANYGNWYLVVVRGTQYWIDWGNDVYFVPMVVVPGIPGLIHPGWNNIAKGIYDAVKVRLHERTDPEVLPILVSGHSMGGAVAQILAHYLDAELTYRTSAVVALAAPKPGDTGFASAARWPVIRINNFVDPVPYLPPGWTWNLLNPARAIARDALAAYGHGGQAFTLYADGSFALLFSDASAAQERVAPLAIQQNPDEFNLTGHDATEYVTRLRARLPHNIQTYPGAWPYLWRTDRVNAQAFASNNYVWNFPIGYPPEPAHDGNSGSGQRASPAPGGHVCLAVPSRGCCQLQ